MKKFRIQMLLALLAFVLCLPLAAQAEGNGCDCKCACPKHQAVLPEKDIIVLYTNDVHCGFEKQAKNPKRLGYSSLAAYRLKCCEETPYVVMVDAGDAVQGETIGTLSKGEYLVDIMNAVRYDFCVLGNHEFDYGMPQLVKLLNSAKAKYLGCNITYNGKGQSGLSSLIQPYAIAKYGKTGSEVKVGYVGISTPESLSKSSPETFKENGEFVYSFNGETPEKFYNCIQKNIDACRQAGADYVIAVGHLGVDEASVPFTSEDVIKHTRGIDAFIDGHSHSTIPCRQVKNLDGKDIVLTSTGSKLEAIGRMVIGKDGSITSTLVTDVQDKDPDVEGVVNALKTQYEAAAKAVVAHSNVPVSDKGSDGCRLVRCRETAIGDLSSDAYRYAAKSDVAVVNGGGIRAGLPAGDITFDNVIAVHPYGNTLACCECTGQDILDALEFAYRATQSKASDGTNAVGECGGFLSVSGLKCTIDTSIPSSVKVDDKGMFVEVSGARRVKDVMVLNDKGEYVPIDPNATYTLASQNFTLKQCGDGFTMFAKKNYVIGEGQADYQMLVNYIESLKGDLSKYSQPDNRITVR